MTILLKTGATGPNVKAWQERLRIKADGIFGLGTKVATIARCRKLVAEGHDCRTDGVVDQLVWTTAGLSAASARAPLPPAGTVNAGLSGARQSTMIALFGAPGVAMTQECQSPVPALQALMLYGVDVGPFHVSGHHKAIASLKGILNELLVSEPDLYQRLGTAGMLCVRAVRGSTRTWSNHSWGTAIDITIDGQLDTYADGSCQSGLITLSRFFNRAGWYWGAEFQREDSMHFECGEQLARVIAT